MANNKEQPVGAMIATIQLPAPPKLVIGSSVCLSSEWERRCAGLGRFAAAESQVSHVLVHAGDDPAQILDVHIAEEIGVDGHFRGHGTYREPDLSSSTPDRRNGPSIGSCSFSGMRSPNATAFINGAPKTPDRGRRAPHSV